MTGFRVWCALLPLLVGFGVPALLTWRPGAPGLRASALFVAALLIATILASFTAPSGALLPVALFITAFAVLVAGLHLVWPWPIAGQIASGLVVSAMMGSIFYIRLEPDLDLPAIQQRIELALALSPYAVLMETLGKDILRGALYSDWADYPIVRPSWQPIALLYVLIGAALAALGRLTARLTTEARNSRSLSDVSRRAR